MTSTTKMMQPKKNSTTKIDVINQIDAITQKNAATKINVNN